MAPYHPLRILFIDGRALLPSNIPSSANADMLELIVFPNLVDAESFLEQGEKVDGLVIPLSERSPPPEERWFQWSRQVPIVVLVEPGNEDLGLQATQMGADDYVVHVPGSPENLWRILRRTIERHQALAADRETESLYSQFFHRMDDHAACLLDAVGTVMDWNLTAQRLQGFSKSDILGKSYSLLFILEEVQSGIPERLLEQTVSQESAIIEGWRVRRDGSRFWATGTLTALRAENGELRGFGHLLHERVERNITEETLRRLVDTQTAMLGSLPAHIALLDEVGTILLVNEAWRHFGAANLFQTDDFGAGQNYLEICYRAVGECAEEASRAGAGIRSILRGDAREFSLEYPCHSPTERRWFRLMATPVLNQGSPQGAVVMHLDITERKLAELERQRLLNELNERVKELQGLHAAANVLRDDHLSTEEILERFVSVMPPAMQYPEITAARVSLGAIERRTNNYRRSSWLLSSSFRTSDERDGCVEIAYLEEKPRETEGPFLAEERTLVDSLAEMLRSFFERRLTLDRLRASEERFRLLANATNDAIWDWDLVTDALWWNEGLTTLFGYRPDEVEPTIESRTRRIHPSDHDRIVSNVHEHIDVGKNHWSAEYRFLCKNGQYAHVFDRGYVIRDGRGRAIRMLGGMTDLTEKKNLESRLLQSQKMEAIGHLAGGVAHDFNNLLTVINGYCEIVMEKLPDDDEKRGMLALIRDAGERAANLTGQLLAFGRKQMMSPQLLDLNGVVSSMEKLLRRLIGEDIQIATLLAPNLHRVRVDPGQLEQVVINLAVNARDAMPRGGQLTIETCNTTIDDHLVRIKPDLRPGPYVALKVSDNGVGIPPAVLPHIFEPFFTTKSVGKGTGLGLATVFGIVKQSEGFIDVYSEVGTGTRFTILFPAVVTKDLESSEKPPPPRRGGETILLVEDEPAVRGIVKHALEGHGYRVFEASNGREALILLENVIEEIHLLVTDVVMPEMSGRELVEQLRERRESLRVLYVSGYTDDAVVRHGIIDEQEAFLQKPFSPDTLARKVREILDARR